MREMDERAAWPAMHESNAIGGSIWSLARMIHDECIKVQGRGPRSQQRMSFFRTAAFNLEGPSHCIESTGQPRLASAQTITSTSSSALFYVHCHQL